MTVNVIGQRMNFMVILHGCWLVVILTRRRRAAIARLWPKYCLFLVVFLLYQYLLCVGMPPALCMGKGYGEWAGGRWGAPRCSVVLFRLPRLPVALEPVPPHELGAHQVALPA